MSKPKDMNVLVETSRESYEDESPCKNEPKTTHTAAATIQVEQNDLRKMYECLQSALAPKVTFDDNMEKMRDEAERVSRVNIKIARDTLHRYLSNDGSRDFY